MGPSPRPVRVVALAVVLALAAGPVAQAVAAVPPVPLLAAAEDVRYEVLEVPRPDGLPYGMAHAVFDTPDGPTVLATAYDGVLVNPATVTETYLYTLRTGAFRRLDSELGADHVGVVGVAEGLRFVGQVRRRPTPSSLEDVRWLTWSPSGSAEWPFHTEDTEDGRPPFLPRDVDSGGTVLGGLTAPGHLGYLTATWSPPASPVLRADPSRPAEMLQVNDAGQAAGAMVLEESQVPALSCGGRSIPLAPELHYPDIRVGSGQWARAISPAGLVAGHIGGHSVLWRDGTAFDLGNIGRLGQWPTSVNDAGTVVGSTGWPGEEWSSVAWRSAAGAQALPLDALIPADAGWRLLTALHVSASGWISGMGVHEGVERAYVLRPLTPQPDPGLAPGSAQPVCTGGPPPPLLDPTPLLRPLPPRAVLGAPGDGEVTVWWQPPRYGAPLLGYRLQWLSEDGTEELVVPPDQTRVTIRGLVNGRPFAPNLYALNSAGTSENGGGGYWVPGAAWARDPVQACPLGTPVRSWSDLPPDSVHAGAVTCAAAWGVVRGTTATTFTPEAVLTRAQAASLLARSVTAAGVALPADPPDAFPDDEGSVHEAAIDSLAAAGLLRGTADGLAGADRQVTRGQLVSLLTRAHAHLTGEALAGPVDLFDDDRGSAHEAAADAAGLAGLVSGVRPRVLDPDRPVRRDHAAALLARGLDLLVETGHVTPPFGRTRP